MIPELTHKQLLASSEQTLVEPLIGCVLLHLQFLYQVALATLFIHYNRDLSQ